MLQWQYCSVVKYSLECCAAPTKDQVILVHYFNTRCQVAESLLWLLTVVQLSDCLVTSNALLLIWFFYSTNNCFLLRHSFALLANLNWFCSVVVITFASHAKGPGFETRQNLLLIDSIFSQVKHRFPVLILCPDPTCLTFNLIDQPELHSSVLSVICL